jgi:protein required for attachment to host cells
MQPTGLIVADGARCRFICAIPAETDEFEPTTALEECADLANPEALLSGQNIYSNTKSGRNRSHPGGPAHGYDDHRDRHHAEMLRRFAREIAAHAERLVKDRGLVGLVLVADARLLGFLREEFPPQLHARITATLDEAATKRSVAELRKLLEQRELLPVAPRAKASYRPRGQAS